MSAFAALTALLLFPGFAVSVTWPSCTESDLAWSYNTLSQSPCEVGAYLISTCLTGDFQLGEIAAGWAYIGPDSPEHSYSCICSTVTYSLLSACAACQGSGWIKWSTWVTNCTQVLPPSTFPNPVPSDISVPYWATLDVTLENTWNENKSMSAGASPEIGPGELIGTSSASSPGTSSASSPSPTGSTTQTPPATGFQAPTISAPNLPTASSSGSSSSNTIAIVGGAVGAVALLAIAFVIVGIFYLRQQRGTNNEARRAMAEDATIASPSMSDLPRTSTPRGLFNPTDPTVGMLLPEMQATPWVPDVSSQVVSGPHQGSGSTLHLRPGSESPPQYDNLSSVAARPSISTRDQPESRGPRLREK